MTMTSLLHARPSPPAEKDGNVYALRDFHQSNGGVGGRANGSSAKIVSPFETFDRDLEEEEEGGPVAAEELEDNQLLRRDRHPYGRNTTSFSNRESGPRLHSRINHLIPPQPNGSPTIICLHGSNDSCMRSWLGMIEVLYKSGHTVLLYDRPRSNSQHGGADLKPHRAVSELCSYLYSAELKGPYVIIAHSYGGCIARLFLQQKPREVAGMVLVETGQETALSVQTEEEQYRRQILGDAPLAVVRGNTMRAKQTEWAKTAAMAKTDSQKAQLEPQRLMLQRWDVEDERLKRKQLGLSRRSHFRQVPHVGHHPIRDAPDQVIMEVKWVMSELVRNSHIGRLQASVGGPASMYSSRHGEGLKRNISNASAGLRRGLSTRIAGGLSRTFSRKARA